MVHGVGSLADPRALHSFPLAGVPLCETDPLLLFFIFFTLKIAAHPGSGE